MTQVEDTSIGAELYVDALVQIFLGFSKHHAEEDREESRG